jgi:hypothetical protein
LERSFKGKKISRYKGFGIGMFLDNECIFNINRAGGRAREKRVEEMGDKRMVQAGRGEGPGREEILKVDFKDFSFYVGG